MWRASSPAGSKRAVVFSIPPTPLSRAVLHVLYSSMQSGYDSPVSASAPVTRRAVAKTSDIWSLTIDCLCKENGNCLLVISDLVVGIIRIIRSTASAVVLFHSVLLATPLEASSHTRILLPLVSSAILAMSRPLGSAVVGHKRASSSDDELVPKRTRLNNAEVSSSTQSLDADDVVVASASSSPGKSIATTLVVQSETLITTVDSLSNIQPGSQITPEMHQKMMETVAIAHSLNKNMTKLAAHLSTELQKKLVAQCVPVGMRRLDDGTLVWLKFHTRDHFHTQGQGTDGAVIDEIQPLPQSTSGKSFTITETMLSLAYLSDIGKSEIGMEITVSDNKPYLFSFLDVTSVLPDNFCAEAACFTASYIGRDEDGFVHLDGFICRLLEYIGEKSERFDKWFEAVEGGRYLLRLEPLSSPQMTEEEKTWRMVTRTAIFGYLKRHFANLGAGPLYTGGMLWAICKSSTQPTSAAQCNNLQFYKKLLKCKKLTVHIDDVGTAVRDGAVNVIKYFCDNFHMQLLQPVHISSLCNRIACRGQLDYLKWLQANCFGFSEIFLNSRCQDAISNGAVNFTQNTFLLDFVLEHFPVRLRVFVAFRHLLQTRNLKFLEKIWPQGVTVPDLTWLLTATPPAAVSVPPPSTGTVAQLHLPVSAVIQAGAQVAMPAAAPQPLVPAGAQPPVLPIEPNLVYNLMRLCRFDFIDFLLDRGLKVPEQHVFFSALLHDSCYHRVPEEPKDISPDNVRLQHHVECSALLRYVIEKKMLTDQRVIFKLLFHRTLALGSIQQIEFVWDACKDFVTTNFASNEALSFDLEISKMYQECAHHMDVNQYDHVGFVAAPTCRTSTAVSSSAIVRKLYDMSSATNILRLSPLVFLILRNNKALTWDFLQSRMPEVHKKLLDSRETGVLAAAIQSGSLEMIKLMDKLGFAWPESAWGDLVISRSQPCDQHQEIVNYMLERAPRDMSKQPTLLTLCHDVLQPSQRTIVNFKLQYIQELWERGLEYPCSFPVAIAMQHVSMCNRLFASGRRPLPEELKHFQVCAHLSAERESIKHFVITLYTSHNISPPQFYLEILMHSDNNSRYDDSTWMEKLLSNSVCVVTTQMVAHALSGRGCIPQPFFRRLLDLLEVRGQPKDLSLCDALVASRFSRKALLRILQKRGFPLSEHALHALQR